MSDIAYMSARQLTENYRKAELSPLEVTGFFLERIERLNPKINAIYFLDAEGALEQARASEARWHKGEPCGALDGVPVTLKDALATKGMPSYRGSVANRAGQGVSDSDAPTVARVKEQGAIILGKNTMCDFGILASGISSKHGVTRNPWNLERNTGASSSGAAASLAAGICPVSVGTDIVGSIRIPASFCGLFGHKPSQGRVPYYFPNDPSLVAGPMARTVEDAALMMNVLSLPDDRDFTALAYDGRDYLEDLDEEIAGKRIAFLTDLGFGLRPDHEVVDQVTAAAGLLADVGHVVEPVSTPFRAGADACAETYYRIRCLAELSTLPDGLQRKAKIIWDWTRPGTKQTAVDLFEALNAMALLREQTMRLMDGYDFLLLPSVPVPPFAADSPAPDPEDIFAPWCNTLLFNLTQQPACSIPCGYTSDGLPIGLQIVGQRWNDMGVLRLARQFERLRPASPDWPRLA